MSWLEKNKNISSIQNTEEREKALTYWRLVIMLLPLGYSFVGIYYYLEAPKSAMMVFTFVSFMFAFGLISFHTKFLDFVGFIRTSIFLYMGLFVSLCFLTGGKESPNIWWLITTPIIAANFSGKKETVFWTSLSLALTMVFFIDPINNLTINELEYTNFEFFRISSKLALAIVFGATGYLSIATKEKVQKQKEEILKNANHSSNLASLGEMAGGIAHEINNPLMIIGGSARALEKILLKEDPDLEKVHSHIDTIKRSTKRAAAIIRGLQNISREGSADETDLFSIGESLDEVLILMGSKFKFEEIELKYDKEDSLFQKKFQLQRVQFSQVILNLMSNAFYAIKDQQKPWIKIEMFKSDKNYYIRVSDSGAKIPTEIVDKMFNPFFTSKPVGEGTGLGLSLCHSIMQRCGGDLIFDRDYPNTSFLITLPPPKEVKSEEKSAA